jgi:hypothetical protein
VQLAQVSWKGEENLLTVAIVCSPEERVALKDAAEEQLRNLPQAPAPEPDRSVFEALEGEVKLAKENLARAQAKALGCESAVVGTPRARAGGQTALLDEKDQAVEDARKAKARFDQLIGMLRRARDDWGQRRLDAQRAALREHRQVLAELLRPLDARLARLMLEELLPGMVAIRAEMDRLAT